MTMGSIRKRDRIIIPDINDTSRHLAQGISRDIDEDYRDTDRLFFDLVIEEKRENIFTALILDNRYKLSKTILDKDEGREAVIIPIKVRPLILSKYKTLAFEERYYSLRRDIYKSLNKLYIGTKIAEYLSKNYRHVLKLKHILHHKA